MADRKTVVQVKHRLRRDLLQRIERSAKTKDRSVNEEIEQRLEESFRQEERAELILEAINRTLKVLGISADLGTWSPEMRAWAAGRLGLFPKAEGASEQPETKVTRRPMSKLRDRASLESPEDTSEQPATDKKEDSK